MDRENRQKLLPQHLEDFRKSGITDASVAKYDISSVSQGEASEALGFRPPSGGWALRYPGSEFFKFKPDKPFNKETKYLSPKDTAQELFITHLASDVHDDSLEPYYFCEGEKKCLALEQAGYAAIGVSGVWNWKSRGHANEALSQINLSGRECYIIFDSDKHFNDHVRKAEERFAEALISLGAKVNRGQRPIYHSIYLSSETNVTSETNLHPLQNLL